MTNFKLVHKKYEELKAQGLTEDQVAEYFSPNSIELTDNDGEDKTKQSKEIAKKERHKHSIVISLHVSSMEKTARVLKKELEAQGYRVWICTDMVAGIDFRTAIVEAVRECTVFLPLINDKWAQSGECSDEFSLAKRLHLTSHESGRTQRSEPRLPTFIPIAFSDLDWTAHPHIQLLSASTNFLVHDGPTFELGY